MVHNRRTDSQATLWSVRSAERNRKGVPLSDFSLLTGHSKVSLDCPFSCCVPYFLAPVISKNPKLGRRRHKNFQKPSKTRQFVKRPFDLEA